MTDTARGQPAPARTRVVAEIHVDDLALERGAPWAAASALVERIAEVAEGAGARLTLRFRETFAREAARQRGHSLLRRLEDRGHEVGTHAHGKHLAAAWRAVSACRVANRGVTPGMVQARAGYGALFDEAATLGFGWMTDCPPRRLWSGAGHLPWRPGPGCSPFRPAGPLVLVEVSVTPFAWGLLSPDGQGQGLDEGRFQRLEELLARHGRRPLPAGLPPYFCVTVHEHDFCAPDSLRPDPAALDAFGAFLGRHRVVTAGEVASGCPPPSVQEVGPRGAAPVPVARTLRWSSGLQDMAPRGLRRLRQDLRSTMDRVGPAGEGAFTVPIGSDLLHAVWIGPRQPRAVVLVSHAGPRGGTSVLLQPFGLDAGDLGAAGVAVVAWDRRGTGRSRAGVDLTPGQPAHVEDFQAVWDHVVGRIHAGTPVGVLSFSSGILPPLRAGRPLAFLVDAEAPADRWTLLPPELPSSPDVDRLTRLSVDDDAAWAGREPRVLVGRLRCPYHRLQAEVDHVHGRLDLHARLLLEGASGAARRRCNGIPWSPGDPPALLPGHLHAHGDLVRRWILDEVER